jgi:hypothetical protein
MASILPAFASPRLDQRHDGVANQRKGHDDHGRFDGVRTCHASSVCCKAAVPLSHALRPIAADSWPVAAGWRSHLPERPESRWRAPHHTTYRNGAWRSLSVTVGGMADPTARAGRGRAQSRLGPSCSSTRCSTRMGLPRRAWAMLCEVALSMAPAEAPRRSRRGATRA